MEVLPKKILENKIQKNQKMKKNPLKSINKREKKIKRIK